MTKVGMRTGCGGNKDSATAQHVKAAPFFPKANLLRSPCFPRSCAQFWVFSGAGGMKLCSDFIVISAERRTEPERSERSERKARRRRSLAPKARKTPMRDSRACGAQRTCSVRARLRRFLPALSTSSYLSGVSQRSSEHSAERVRALVGGATSREAMS